MSARSFTSIGAANPCSRARFPGGRDITTAICQKYQIPVEQAEAAKLDHGFVVTSPQRADATAEQLEFSDTLLEPISALFGLIKQTELSCKNLTQQPLGHIYLSGGTSLLPGLAKVLEEHVGTPVRQLLALSSVSLPRSHLLGNRPTAPTFSPPRWLCAWSDPTAPP